jgi:hypothetical protein
MGWLAAVTFMIKLTGILLYSWTFLEKSVDSVMIKLEDGLTMTAVSSIPCLDLREDANLLPYRFLVYGYLYVGHTPTFGWNHSN